MLLRCGQCELLIKDCNHCTEVIAKGAGLLKDGKICRSIITTPVRLEIFLLDIAASVEQLAIAALETSG